MGEEGGERVRKWGSAPCPPPGTGTRETVTSFTFSLDTWGKKAQSGAPDLLTDTQHTKARQGQRSKFPDTFFPLVPSPLTSHLPTPSP